MYQGIIFDLDGTLWDSTAQILPAWNRVLARCNTCSPMTLPEFQSYMGKTIEEIAAIKLPHLPLKEGAAIFSECCKEELIELAKSGGVLYPNLAETLGTLHQNHFLAIVSNCQNGYIQTFLEFHRLRDFFDDFLCFGQTQLPKGENIQLLMERNNLQTAVYVGDTQGDFDAARQAGIPFIYAAYGFGEVPDRSYRLNTICELPKLLKELVVLSE
ncbi:MAG: HAD family hydrolase [Emergencia sp.]|uniref:HAD family hydrolase n=1 Tax=Senimuribacter intestinalis TaxID=2941507 RepID=UPI00203D99B5|nr:HAD family hydrolase [Senimuribacter intestinalis]MCI9639154.1 HAD family hydrolase [Emergencia sp.]